MRTTSVLIVATALLFITTVVNGQTERPSKDLNLIPMYGYPYLEKPDHLKKADEQFIEVITAKMPREEASLYFAVIGWEFARTGDRDTAMKRFNQAWLLNPENYRPYWGFGKLLTLQNQLPDAIMHYEKALSLIDKNEQIPCLLIDAAFTYSTLGVMTRTKGVDISVSDRLFAKANSLFSEAITLQPTLKKAYDLWASSLYMQGDYEKAWELVGKARSLGFQLRPDFIESLSQKIPEPKIH